MDLGAIILTGFSTLVGVFAGGAITVGVSRRYYRKASEELRTLNALTQEELAEKADITATALSRIERNEAEPRPKTLRKLAAALGVTPAELIRSE